jgi:Domain of unknown function (DUF4145)
MAPKFVPPAINRKSFSCPHCGALADQAWFKLHASHIKDDDVPHLASTERLRRIKEVKKQAPEQYETIDYFIAVTERELKGAVFMTGGETLFSPKDVHNLHRSRCYSCEEYCVWKFDSLLYPSERYEIEPNPDMPDDVKVDFEEARRILNDSPRAAAALLRLCVQKICSFLLRKESDINAAIKELVKKGLRVEIQQALDGVRVVGNESVHPGVMNLNDDRDTATTLFELVNIIV